MLIGQNQCGRNIIPMPVNGLLVKLSLDPLLADAALAGISKCPEALLGDAQDRWQPLAVDTPDVRAAHDFHEWLEALPGVGRKTANVVLNVAFGEPTCAVDTHIFRVGNRTGLAKGKTPLAVERQLEKKVPQPFRVGAHHWLILHGRYTCLARKPKCEGCQVRDLCPSAELFVGG